MKISKKILGVVLVLTMILNVFAVGAFAAFPDDTAVKLMIATDKETYAPGDEIVLTVSEQVISAIGTVYIGGQYEIAYNGAAVEPYSTSGDLDPHGFTAIQEGYDSSISGVQIPAQSSGASLAGTDTTICYVVGDSSVAIDATNKVDLFTVKMKIKADAPDGTYTIGFNPAGYEECNAFSNDGIGMGGLYGTDASALGFPVPNMYEYGSVTFTVGEGGSTGPTEPTEPTATLANLDPRVQWKESGSNVICIGFEGQITGEAIVVDDVVNSKIAEIGFEFSTTDNSLNGATKVKVDKIYDFTGNTPNTYKFRAVVVKAMSEADATDPDEGGYTHNLYARAYVTIGDKTTYATDIIETTVYDEYSEGVAGGLATLAANLG